MGDQGLGPAEHEQHPQETDPRRDRTGQPRAEDAERDTSAPARDQHGRQDGVEDDRARLQQHGRPRHARRAQRRPHGVGREAQGQRRQEAEQIGLAHGRGLRVRRDRRQSRFGRQIADDEGRRAQAQRQDHRLAINALSSAEILRPDRSRDQRQGPDSDHLRQCQAEEEGVPRQPHARNRRSAEARDEVQVDDEIEGLEHEADADEPGHPHQFPGDRSLSQILLHRVLPELRSIAVLRDGFIRVLFARQYCPGNISTARAARRWSPGVPADRVTPRFRRRRPESSGSRSARSS